MMWAAVEWTVGIMAATRALTMWAVGMDNMGSRGVDSGHHGSNESTDDTGSGHR